MWSWTFLVKLSNIFNSFSLNLSAMLLKDQCVKFLQVEVFGQSSYLVTEWPTTKSHQHFADLICAEFQTSLGFNISTKPAAAAACAGAAKPFIIQHNAHCWLKWCKAPGSAGLELRKYCMLCGFGFYSSLCRSLMDRESVLTITRLWGWSRKEPFCFSLILSHFKSQ